MHLHLGLPCNFTLYYMMLLFYLLRRHQHAVSLKVLVISSLCAYIHACCTELQQRLGICKIRIIRMKSFTAVCGSEMVKAFFPFCEQTVVRFK